MDSNDERLSFYAARTFGIQICLFLGLGGPIVYTIFGELNYTDLCLSFLHPSWDYLLQSYYQSLPHEA